MARVDLSVFHDYSIIALIDQDPESNSSRKAFENECAKINIDVVRLERYAIENYLSLEAIKDCFRGEAVEIESLDPNVKIKEQIGFSVKSKNRSIARAMSEEDFMGTDLWEFIEKVEERCEELSESASQKAI
jgi:hypothetical protein